MEQADTQICLWIKGEESDGELFDELLNAHRDRSAAIIRWQVVNRRKNKEKKFSEERCVKGNEMCTEGNAAIVYEEHSETTKF